MPEFPRATTEGTLREWRHGQVEAERLSAAILHLDGFEDIDPQAPLGGPDGRKDILCSKRNTAYVAAAYFPNVDKAFSDIKGKFEDDLEGAIRHNRQGFVFITSQHIGLSDRTTLEQIAADKEKLCILYHRERIRGVLDSPVGYGVRLEFLRIPMNEAEQFAYFASSSNRLEYALERHSREIRNLAGRIDILRAGQDFAVQTIYQVATRLGADVSSPPVNLDRTTPVLLQGEADIRPLSASINPALLLSIHRLVCNDLPFNMVGKFRNSTAWIGALGSSPEEAEHVPPPPEEILQKLNEILAGWNEGYEELAASDAPDKYAALARFHHTLTALHPFMDGNGRVARAVLVQQSIDLLGHVDPSLLDSGADYYLAVKKADSGNFEPLETLIQTAVTH